jgi:hypothetical protein
VTIEETVLVVADDLIWASRLVEAVHRAGAAPVRLGSERDLAIALAASDPVEPLPDGVDPDQAVPPRAVPPRPVGAIVDLLGRRYDGVDAIGRLSAARVPVIAVAEHDDLATRKRALGAGARRVFSYAKFFTDGPSLVATWLAASRGEG